MANVYRDGALVKSTQSAVAGAKSATHTAEVKLADGTYALKYNAHDAAGNVSATGNLEFVIDSTPPTATIKEGAQFTVPTSGGGFELVSFKLQVQGKIDRVDINGQVKDLTDNRWSDVNFVKPGTFGAIKGANTLTIYDVAGNSSTVEFTLE